MNESAPSPMTGQALVWRFGGFSYDEAARRLARDGERAAIALERKPLDVLAILLRHSGEVVTKDELAEAAWTRRTPGDAVIAKAVGKLRAALNDSEQTLIRTVHGVGYQLTAGLQVELRGDDAPSRRLDLEPGDAPPRREHWRLERRLGTGGYGEAWLASHRATREQRVFKFAIDRSALTALKREITLNRLLRETLGPRDDIQWLLDWNLSTAPYFVESAYVSSGSLIEWSEGQGGAAGIGLAVRLELVAQVADALAAAHSAGVLHKDLKPANVLVAGDAEGRPQIRLCDFGSGHVIDTATLEKLGITRLGFTRTAAVDPGHTSGTAPYLAPEALAGQPVTSKGDIYALGVMLYQLCIGDFGRPVASGWERDIDEPLLSEDIAACIDGDPALRLGDAAEVARRLRTLDQRRAERVAAEQAAREKRVLRQRLTRVRQRRTLFASVSAVLALGLVSTLTFYVRERQATVEAVRHANIAETINGFVVEDLLGLANPEKTGRREPSLRELVDLAAGRAGQRFGGEPLLEGSLRTTLGQIYGGLAQDDKAREQFEIAIRALETQGASARRELTAARIELGRNLVRTGDYHGAIRLLEPVASLPKNDHAMRDQRLRARIELAAAFTELGRLDEAVLDLQEVLAELRPEERTLAARAYENQSRAQFLAGDYEAAAAAVSTGAGLHVDNPYAALRAQVTHAAILMQMNRSPEALDILQPARARALEVYAPDHFEVLRAQLFMARAHYRLRQYSEAEGILQAALPLAIDSFGEGNQLTREMRTDLANVVGDVGRYDEALALYQLIEAQDREQIGAEYYPTHYLRFTLAFNRAVTLNQAERWGEAAAVLRPLLSQVREVRSKDRLLPAAMGLAYTEAMMRSGGAREGLAPLLDEAILRLGDPTVGNSHFLEKARSLRRELRDDLLSARAAEGGEAASIASQE